MDGLSQVEVGDLLERHKSWVNRRVSLYRQVSSHLLEDLSLGLLGQGALRKLAQLPARNQEELWAVARRGELSTRDTASLVDLWRRAPDPQARRYLLEHPEEALRRAQMKTEVAEDPRLGPWGREVLRALGLLRQVSVKLVRRLSEGLGEMSPQGLQMLLEAREQAEHDCRRALEKLAELGGAR